MTTVNLSASPLNLFNDDYDVYNNPIQPISKLHQSKLDNYQLKKLCLQEVKKNGMELQYVIFQEDDICIEAVKSNPNSLQFVQDKKLKICKIAINLNGFTVKHVNLTHPNYEELCELASIKTGYTLKVIQKQTPKICVNAIEKDNKSYKYMNIFTNEIFDGFLDKKMITLYI